MTPKLLNADWNYWPEKQAPESIWASCAALGFDGIELGVYDPAEQLSEERVATYRSLVEKHDLPVGMVLYSMPPWRWPEGGLGNAEHAARAIEGALVTARVGRDAFGCSVLGLWPGADVLDRTTRPAQVWPTLVASFADLTEALADLGMELAVEYKPREMLGNADAALRLCDAVGRDEIGVLLDTGHALWAGEDLPVALHLVGDRLKHVHLGDTPGPTEADLPPGWHHDFTGFMTAIDEIGYEGVMSLDMYGAIEGGIIGSGAASRYGHDTMDRAAARARGQR